MTTTRYKDGDVTVTLSGDIEAWVRRATTAAGGEVLRVLREDAEQVARLASGQWYDLVQRRTGLSGQIRVAEMVDATAETVTVSVGSVDTRIAGKTRVPVPRVVATPGPDALVLVEVSHKEYFDTPKPLRYRYPRIFQRHPKAGSRRVSLLKLLVVDPMEAAVMSSQGELSRRVADAAERA